MGTSAVPMGALVTITACCLDDVADRTYRVVGTHAQTYSTAARRLGARRFPVDDLDDLVADMDAAAVQVAAGTRSVVKKGAQVVKTRLQAEGRWRAPRTLAPLRHHV